MISVGSSSSDRMFAATAWLDGIDPFVAIPAAAPTSVTNVRAEITDVGSLDPTGLACAELPSGSLTGKLALIFRGTCFFEDKLNVAQRAGAVAAIVYTDEARPEPATMSVGAATLPAVMIGYQDGVRAKQRLAGGTTITAVVDFEAKPFSVNAARLADFTSKGPGVQNLIKPDLVATGTSIYTAQPVSSGEPRYAALDGTSFSAPMVTGAAALLKAYRPGLNVAQYKSLLANSATTFSANDVTFPVQQTGAGLLDITAAVRSSVISTASSINFGAGESVIDSTQRFTLKNIGKTPDTYSVSVLPLTTGATPEVSPNVVDLQPGAAARDRGTSCGSEFAGPGVRRLPGHTWHANRSCFENPLLVRGNKRDRVNNRRRRSAFLGATFVHRRVSGSIARQRGRRGDGGTECQGRFRCGSPRLHRGIV